MTARVLRAGFRAVLVVLALALPARSAPEAQADAARTFVRDGWRGVDVELGLDALVPFRLTFLDAPPRLVVDLAGLDWGRGDPAHLVSRLVSGRITAARLGRNALNPGWARLVLTLDRAYAVRSAGLDSASSVLRIVLAPTDADTFAALVAGSHDPAAVPLTPPRPRQNGNRDVVVVIDPGHGGVDPGAERGGTHEAALMLAFAREVAAALTRVGGFAPVLTREADVFVPLEARIAIAHGAGADVFVSLHADALAEGQASGATVYTLADTASDAASAWLAERHDRAGMLAGVDLTGQDDEVGRILMGLARIETAPRAARLAADLVAAMGAAGGPLTRIPQRKAGFSVLKSPAVPSVLVEVGYMSNAADLGRITDPVWRARMAGAIAAGLADWAQQDAAQARLLRR